MNEAAEALRKRNMIGSWGDLMDKGADEIERLEVKIERLQEEIKLLHSEIDAFNPEAIAFGALINYFYDVESPEPEVNVCSNYERLLANNAVLMTEQEAAVRYIEHMEADNRRLQAELAETQAAYAEHVNAEDSAWKKEAGRLEEKVEQMEADSFPNRTALYVHAIEAEARLEAENERLKEEHRRVLKKIDELRDIVHGLAMTIKRLRADCEGEIAEFNAGWECASNGGTEADEPMDVPHDVWMCGFAWQRHDGLKAGVARLQAVKAAAIKVVEQTTPDAAYQLHDDLIAAIESVEGPGWEVK